MPHQVLTKSIEHIRIPSFILVINITAEIRYRIQKEKSLAIRTASKTNGKNHKTIQATDCKKNN
jgi:hypothetical protein